MKKLFSLLLVLMMLPSSALAFNFSRFDGAAGVNVAYDPAMPASYRVTSGFDEIGALDQMSGHLVVRYMNAGKSEELPLILVAFTSDGRRVSRIEIRTDSNRYSVVCTDLAAAGLQSIESEAMVLVTAESADMLRDIASSSYVRIAAWDEDPDKAFTFLLDGSACRRLAMFLDEYDEEIVPRLTEGATLTRVYAKLTAEVEKLQAPEIGPGAALIANSDYTAMQKGDRGAAVEKLQRWLSGAGFFDGDADGIYGKQTAAAVSSFQSSIGMAQTGVADEITQIELLLAMFAKAA